MPTRLELDVLGCDKPTLITYYVVSALVNSLRKEVSALVNSLRKHGQIATKGGCKNLHKNALNKNVIRTGRGIDNLALRESARQKGN